MKIVKLFSDIIITEGYYRAVVQDYHRHKIYYIPLALSDLIRKYNGLLYENNLLKFLNKQNNSIYQDYYNFLVENDLIFSIDETLLPLFPPISTKYESPFYIDSLTIMMSKQNFESVLSAFNRQVFFNIFCFSFIFCDDVDSNKMDYFLKKVVKQEIRYVKVVYNSKKKVSVFLRDNRSPLIFERRTEFAIDASYFKSNDYQKFPIFNNEFYLYTESLQYNPYFHKRVFIDGNGFIRNSPETLSHFSTIDRIDTYTDLITLVHSPLFTKYDHITKDKIEICKLCEARYMCIDNRVPIKREKYWIHLAKCTYNPYICKWEGEEGYVPVEECGTYSRETGFVPDDKKIKELNKKLWEEDE